MQLLRLITSRYPGFRPGCGALTPPLCQEVATYPGGSRLLQSIISGAHSWSVLLTRESAKSSAFTLCALLEAINSNSAVQPLKEPAQEILPDSPKCGRVADEPVPERETQETDVSVDFASDLMVIDRDSSPASFPEIDTMELICEDMVRISDSEAVDDLENTVRIRPGAEEAVEVLIEEADH